MSKTYQHDLLTGSHTAHIIRLALPMIVAMLFQTGFSVIDIAAYIVYQRSFARLADT